MWTGGTVPAIVAALWMAAVAGGTADTGGTPAVREAAATTEIRPAVGSWDHRGQAAAADPADSLDQSVLTPAELDARTAEVAARLRCPVCRGQSVLESSAELSRSMQRVIRARLAAGESPEQVEAYFVSRYGEWILLEPEPRGLNLLVYVLPAIAVIGGLGAAGLLVRKWARKRGGEGGAGAYPDGRHGPSTTADAGGGGAAAGADAGRATAAGRESDSAERPTALDLAEEDRRWLEAAVRQG